MAMFAPFKKKAKGANMAIMSHPHVLNEFLSVCLPPRASERFKNNIQPYVFIIRRIIIDIPASLWPEYFYKDISIDWDLEVWGTVWRHPRQSTSGTEVSFVAIKTLCNFVSFTLPYIVDVTFRISTNILQTSFYFQTDIIFGWLIVNLHCRDKIYLLLYIYLLLFISSNFHAWILFKWYFSEIGTSSLIPSHQYRIITCLAK